MILAKVAGTVVASSNADGVRGRVGGGRYLVVLPVDNPKAPPKGWAGISTTGTKGPSAALIALDLVQADRGQTVLVSQGSSARQTETTDGTAIDAIVVGIVDDIHVEMGEASH